MIKTFSFKISNNYEGIELIKNAISEYNEYKKKVSGYLTGRLFDPISSILPYITSKDSTYYKIAEGNKDDLIYNLLSGKYDKNSSDNILNAWFNAINIESYTSNSMGVSETDYKRWGYRKTLFANLRTSMEKIKPSVRREIVTEESSDETMTNQIHYEMSNRNVKNASDMKNFIEHISQKSDKNEDYLNRLNILYAYFKVHEDDVLSSYNKKIAEKLKNFKGVSVSSVQSMTFSNAEIKMEECNGDFIIHLGKLRIPVYGNRQVIKNYVEKYNTNGNITQGIKFKVRGGIIYVDATLKGIDNVEREEKNGKKVGADINTKHTLTTTTIIDDGSLVNYVNIEKELAKNNTISEEDRNYFKDISQYVTFCPIETEALLSRYYKDKNMPYSERHRTLDIAITEAIESLIKDNSNNPYIVNYLYNVKKFRACIKSLFVLDKAYHNAKSAFDLEKSDENDLFENTEKGMELLSKLERAQTDINGCRDNIIAYAYDVFSRSGYSTLCLEDLQSANFSKKRYLPKPSAILEYYGCEGKTMDEAKGILAKRGQFFGYYNFTTDNDGKITDVCISERGERLNDLNYFHNSILKKVHFASVKDKFLQLSNNGKMNVCLAPAEYSSLMDSITHKLYVDENMKLLPKDKVRPTQEKHRNGLNADYNSACNILHMCTDLTFREMFLTVNKNRNEYSQPYMMPKKKKNIAAALIKMGYAEVIKEDEDIF